MTTQRAQAMDRHVGRRIRERRISLGMTPPQFAALIGVSSQQACKYEKGTNRITSGRIWNAAQALGVTVGWFFQDFDPKKLDHPAKTSRMSTGLLRAAAAMDEKYLGALEHITSVLAEPGGSER